MPFPVVCGSSHNSSWFESYGLTKLNDPHMIALKPQKFKEVKVLTDEDYLNNKVK